MVGPDEEYLEYDHVVMACHADQTLKLIQPSTIENDLLKNFEYVENHAYLHCDETFMPRARNAWSSWNAFSNKDAPESCVTYWLNKLQNLNTKIIIFYIKPNFKIDNGKVIKKIKFTHPSFNLKTYSYKRASESPRQTKYLLWKLFWLWIS